MQHRPHAHLRAFYCRASNPLDGSRFRVVSRLLFVCAAVVLLSSCRMAGVLDPQGPIAAQELLLLINTTEIMLVVVVPVLSAFLAAGTFSSITSTFVSGR